MAAGLIGCGVAQALNTTVPYALYGIAASAIVLIAFAARTPAARSVAQVEPQLEGTAEA
jgi:SSS family solute:Na+ symporter